MGKAVTERVSYKKKWQEKKQCGFRIVAIPQISNLKRGVRFP